MKRPGRPSRSVHPLAIALRKIGWTQTQLADAAGISSQHISAVLTGRKPGFGVVAAYRVLHALPPRVTDRHVTIHILLGRAERSRAA